ncbi:BON domain-containing protein [Hydrogenophaga flava]|uniref:BON domain-containing protein n=1 Tax=Hydrogenophaga flava TaxID=65657 RepID=UPI0009FEE078|nr:BON domain-containing protein [Hydrogenophaga flava]
MKLSNRAQVVIATTAVLLSLTACGQQEDATVGQKIDGAINSTEQAAQQAKQDMESTAADIKREGEQAVQSVATTATDMTITTKVKAALAADDQLSALKIEVDTVQGVVSLTGPAPTAEAADRATTLAKAVEGVTDVQNKLVVGGQG